MLSELVDVVICWIVDTGLINEPQIQVMNHACINLLKEGGVTIPYSFTSQVELLSMDYSCNNFNFKLFSVENEYMKERIKPISNKVIYHRVLFTKDNCIDVNAYLEIPVEKDGKLNAIRISSYSNLTEDIILNPTEFTLRPYIIPLEKNYEVEKNQKVTLNISYKLGKGWRYFSSNIEVS